MFTPKAPIRQSLATKKPLPRYLVALEMNSRPPDATATTNAPQVSGRMPCVTRLTGRLIQASPRSRRSTARIDPTTRQIANTWIDSISGNSRSFSRILSASALFSKYEIGSAKSGIIRPACRRSSVRRRGCRTRPEWRRSPRAARRFGVYNPAPKIPAPRAATIAGQGSAAQHGEQPHLEIEGVVKERPPWLTDDQQTSGDQEDQQHRPDRRQEAPSDVRQRHVSLQRAVEP